MCKRQFRLKKYLKTRRGENILGDVAQFYFRVHNIAPGLNFQEKKIEKIHFLNLYFNNEIKK